MLEETCSNVFFYTLLIVGMTRSELQDDSKLNVKNVGARCSV
jgi:hypothetical protein